MTYAASQYQKQSGAYLPPRELEAMAFRHVNDLLARARRSHERVEALSANLKLWGILMQSLQRVDCPLDVILQKDLLTLGSWSMNQSNKALNNTDSIQPIIDINTDMIEGLSASIPPDASMPAFQASATSSTSLDRSSLELTG
ncbi:flagellar biosynthesis regulator FlaF [Gluconobacter morbifer]|nr:flagellar biosynthesis regulator FlaF [Gluconobacter morbifer]